MTLADSQMYAMSLEFIEEVIPEAGAFDLFASFINPPLISADLSSS
jgi:hypothetical protein